jgi:hypothetical protein
LPSQQATAKSNKQKRILVIICKEEPTKNFLANRSQFGVRRGEGTNRREAKQEMNGRRTGDEQEMNRR